MGKLSARNFSAWLVLVFLGSSTVFAQNKFVQKEFSQKEKDSMQVMSMSIDVVRGKENLTRISPIWEDPQNPGPGDFEPFPPPGPGDYNPYPLPGGGTTIIPILDEIVNFGAKVFDLIKQNRPVVKTEFATAHAIPKETQPFDLEGWQDPKAVAFEVSYKNKLGGVVTKYRYVIVFTYGGSYNETGQYIANATVYAEDLRVGWSYNFESTAVAKDPVNIRTKANPLAGLQFNVSWTVASPLVHQQNAMVFFLKGDGTLVPVIPKKQGLTAVSKGIIQGNDFFEMNPSETHFEYLITPEEEPLKRL